MTYKRAISHVHTYHSFDSATPPWKIVERAVRFGINYLVISDHDSLEGSIEAAAYAAKKGYDIRIPVSAEYTTNIGDIVITGVRPDFKRQKDHILLCREAKEQGAYTIMPHPYKGHSLGKVDFDLIDCIEVFNSRCTIHENMQALELAHKLGKPMVYGSDAHTLSDLCNAIFAYRGENPFDGQTAPLRLLPTPWQHNEYSRLIRGIKLRKPKEVLRAVKRSIECSINQCFRKRDE